MVRVIFQSGTPPGKETGVDVKPVIVGPGFEDLPGIVESYGRRSRFGSRSSHIKTRLHRLNPMYREPVPKLIDCALKRAVLGQAPVLFQAYRPYKSTFYTIAFPKLRFWESLSFQVPPLPV